MIELTYRFSEHRLGCECCTDNESYIERRDLETSEEMSDDVIGVTLYDKAHFEEYLSNYYGADWKEHYIISEDCGYY